MHLKSLVFALPLVALSLLACSGDGAERTDESDDQLGRTTTNKKGGGSSNGPSGAPSTDNRLRYVMCASWGTGCDPGYYQGAPTFAAACGYASGNNAFYCDPIPSQLDYITCERKCAEGFYPKRHLWSPSCGPYQIPASSAYTYTNATDCYPHFGQAHYSCDGCAAGFSMRGTSGVSKPCDGGLSAASYCVPIQ